MNRFTIRSQVLVGVSQTNDCPTFQGKSSEGFRELSAGSFVHQVRELFQSVQNDADSFCTSIRSHALDGVGKLTGTETIVAFRQHMKSVLFSDDEFLKQPIDCIVHIEIVDLGRINQVIFDTLY